MVRAKENAKFQMNRRNMKHIFPYKSSFFSDFAFCFVLFFFLALDPQFIITDIIAHTCTSICTVHNGMVWQKLQK